ncbi:MAG: MFS transporter [Paenibacillus dendritiformis]|uniref:MFS transporter n=1 Tax=Paenibacillus dendritiformis TaxID=130049 RepID=UPI00143D11E1|nr:MFS transporter [Paenibacillus dendritiformis]MDU5146134.1 MFS transporter [Paenibacillus dendritiformis]NKI24895.1 MFS transporter [Paenibacillus dendritiformis]NRG00053.1 MFS transporter [Paenibacillus dendritiformis]GIO75273.1 MFS transporter [Paenibacillus dendritiformis]
MNQLFRNKAFLIITGSDLLQNLAIWVRNMAILYFIMEQTQGDPVAVSLITVLEYVPIFVFSIIGGALADRWNPKRTMITGDILSALSIVAIIAVLASGYWVVLYAATFVSSIVSQFSQPSSVKIIKRNVGDKHVQSAIAITQSSQSLFLILGPIAGTFIYTVLGIMASMYALLGLFLASAFILSFLPKDTASRDADTSLLADIKEGWGYVLQSRSLRMLALVFMCLGLSSGLINPLEIFLVTERLGLEQTSVQFLAGASGFGLLAGGGIAAAVSGRLNQSATLLFGIGFLAAATLGEVLSGWFWLTLVASFLSSVSLAFVNVVISTYLVARIDEAMIGRVNGTIAPLFVGAMLLGSASSGVLMNATSLFAVYAVSVLVLFVSILPGRRVQFASNKAGSAAANLAVPGQAVE